jgi:hypothetical protein
VIVESWAALYVRDEAKRSGAEEERLTLDVGMSLADLWQVKLIPEVVDK